MSLADLSDPTAVERAIAEFDRIGRDAFLKKYGFGRSRDYELLHEGRRYDVKAIVGAAHGYEFPAEGPLTSEQFGSGARSTVPKLESLGFRVENRRAGDPKRVGHGAFLFNANPRYYDIDAAVRSREEMNWSVKQNGRRIRAGDRVYIWRSGPDRGVIAEGTILTDPALLPEQEGREFIRDEEKFEGEQLRVRLSIDRVLDRPLAGVDLKLHPVLSGMRIFEVANNTNYRLTSEEDMALQGLIRDRVGLRERVEQWREETGYPNAIDRQRQSERQLLATGLSQPNLKAAMETPSDENWSAIAFDQFAHKAYGDPGNQSTVNQALKAEPETRRRVAVALHHLLYGERTSGHDEVGRLNDVLTDEDLRVPGLSESLATKALAVVNPERWLPLYQYRGAMGKLSLMASSELELEVPAGLEREPRAERIALTNDLLRAKVEPLLPGDPWGQMVFLYWLREQHQWQVSADEDDEPERESYSEPGFEEILESIASAGLSIDDRTLLRYHLSLKTRGFVILSGLSGSGKTWLAELYARAVGAEHLLVAVAPNWTANEDLLGYLNPISDSLQYTEFTQFIRKAEREWRLAEQQERVAFPYYVTLDEMNLARVEYYFARFLSAMEIRARDEVAPLELAPGHRLDLTPNLYFSGTVNIDETTHGFADKVLDRAQLIELKVSREALGEKIGDVPYREDLMRVWDAVHEVAPFAFRVLTEVAAYVQRSEALRQGWEEPLDEQLLQKVLPKVRGANPAIGSSLRELLEICDGRLPLTEAKVKSMREHFEQHEFASYF